MNWREATAIVWLGFALGALTDTAVRTRAPAASGAAEAGHDTAGLAETRQYGDGSAEAGHYTSGPAKVGHDDRNVESFSRTETSRRSDGESGSSRTDGRDEAAVATTGVTVESAVDALRHRDLDVPVDGVHRKDLHDTFTDTRAGARAHEALDIMATRHTPVHAVEDGTIQKLFTSKAGGLTVYQFDPSQTFCYYYAHLDGYAAGLREGQSVHKGDVIGYVGSTGNASPDAPHLHFAIFRLTPERQWWKGEPINPYPVLR
jgi:murein DD-endopeptidase MepM/ murein hydrolase activator NlpD